MKVAAFGTLVLLLSTSLSALAQRASDSATPLAQLLQEASAENPQILAAEHASKATAQEIAQSTTTFVPAMLNTDPSDRR